MTSPQSPSQPNRNTLRDLTESELVVALFRTLVIILVALLPRVSGTGVAYSTAGFAFLVGASVYNLLAAILYWRRLTLPFQRHLMVVLDLTLVTVYIHLGALPKIQLFPLYYLITIVAAIWFKVWGALAVATLASVLHVLLIAASGIQAEAIRELLRQSLTLNIPFLYLVALLSGYLAEAQEHERAGLSEARELIDQYEHELRFSRQIQRLLLAGPVPETQGLELGWRVQPARVHAGGDYFEVLELADGRLGLCIADVAGKSLDAQIRLPLLKYALRAVAPESLSSAHVVARLNTLVYQDLQPDMYVGFCYVVLDPREGTIVYCNAGHAPPLLLAPGRDEPEELQTLGPALGVVADWTYTERRTTLPRSGVLVLYTDGVLDARNDAAQGFGEERLRQFLRDHASLPAKQLANALVDTVNEFERGGKRDDLTVLVARRT